MVCADHVQAASLAPKDALTYGFSEGAEFQIADFVGGRADIAFELRRSGALLGRFNVPVPGRREKHVKNRPQRFAPRPHSGYQWTRPAVHSRRFTGVARRYAFRGEAAGVTFVDDYAHLPAEVAVTLAAARLGGFDRTVAIFQPHRYSRVASLAPDFADAFGDADVVVVTSIYSAGESVLPGVSGALVADAVRRARAPRQRGLLHPTARRAVELPAGGEPASGRLLLDHVARRR